MFPSLTQRARSVPPLVWLLAIIAACLMFFAGKPLHIDDMLFVRVAEHIRHHPADFYGFSMNWWGETMPMVQIMDMPPLACYYLAIAGSIGGWQEPVLHLAMLVPSLAAVAGIFALARHFCARPLTAAVVAGLTPVFFLTASSLMCDMLMVAFWVWSLVLFQRGLDRPTWAAYMGCGLLAGLAFWTKYTAAALIPLLAFYGFCHQRRFGRWIISPLMALVFVAAYEWVIRRLYGVSPLFSAASYSSGKITEGGTLLDRAGVGLTFIGGCFLPVLFYLPRLWSRRSLIWGLYLLVPCAWIAAELGPFKALATGHRAWWVWVQATIFVAGGLHVLFLAAADFRDHREAGSLLLSVWLLGILVFATGLNWTVNGRSILPMLPAVGILVARRLERQADSSAQPRWNLLWPAIAAGALCVLVVQADYALAETGRRAATEACAQYLRPGGNLWFEGHWGFQYYMEQHGAKALEPDLAAVQRGDRVIIPREAVNTFDLPDGLLHHIATLKYKPASPISIMNRTAGAGFYAAIAGPLPFSVTPKPPERYYVFELTNSLASATR